MSERERWSAVVARDATFDGSFVYCVKTTKIYCRPICKARLARRANVEFRDTPAEAEAAGYRACKRCRPQLALYNPESEKVQAVCNTLDALPDTARIPSLAVLAYQVGLTKHHFHRLFKRETGLTPRMYALSSRGGATNSESPDSAAVTPVPALDVDTLFTTDERFLNPQIIEMPLVTDDKDWSFEMQQFTVYYNIAETTFGLLLVAFHNHEVCKIELGVDRHQLMGALEASYSSLCYLHTPVDVANTETTGYMYQRIMTVVEALETPSGKLLEPGLTSSVRTIGM